MRIATLGRLRRWYRRHLSKPELRSSSAENAAVLGRVTMDQIMVDVSALDSVEPGEEVVPSAARAMRKSPWANLRLRLGRFRGKFYRARERVARMHA
jgi:hypothetical protein